MVLLILEAGCMWDRVNLAQCVVPLGHPNCTLNYRCLVSASMLCNVYSAEPKLQTFIAKIQSPSRLPPVKLHHVCFLIPLLSSY